MSYLDYPRLHFSGGFSADPSTINNTPNNYSDSNEATKDLELYWNPNGRGTFNLHQCKVTKVVYGPGDETTDATKDPVIGQPVAAVYTMAEPKIVDLDPDQQNVSELWGMRIQVAGPVPSANPLVELVSGDYEAGSFNAIWAQAQKGPHSSASGSGVYQSTLTNLNWNVGNTPKSRFLAELKAKAPQMLSINFVVNAHNNAPPIYAFNDDTFKAMQGAPYNIPLAIIIKLAPMAQYVQNTGRTKGDVPTESFVNHELVRLLGEADAKQYGPDILQATTTKYDPGNIDTAFTRGLLKGTIGPSEAEAPTFYTPGRTLAPPSGSKCYFAPFNFDQQEQRLVLNLGNSLPTNTPGYDTAEDILGDVVVVYFDQDQKLGIHTDNAVPFVSVPSGAALKDLLQHSAGIMDTVIDSNLLPKGISTDVAAAKIANMPLGLMQTNTEKPAIFLKEQVAGYNLRADRFVFRMTPGVATSATETQGDSAIVNIYVTRFGKPAANVNVLVNKMSQIDALTYTNGTLGTSGTQGVMNISTPQEALTLTSPTTGQSSFCDSVHIRTNDQGVAQLDLTASDPGEPRKSQNLDGQVYFVQYNFADPDLFTTFTQDANDMVSVLVFTQYAIPEHPTWDNSIRYILPQYGKLYPIMSRFGLNDYDSVVNYAQSIADVIRRPLTDPLHMPVIRDLSPHRTEAILKWIDAGKPKSNISAE